LWLACRLIGTCCAAADDGGWWFLHLGISNSANLLTQPVVTVLIGLPAAVIDGRRPVAVVCVFLVEMQYMCASAHHFISCIYKNAKEQL
jgi:hypothetical protein